MDNKQIIISDWVIFQHGYLIRVAGFVGEDSTFRVSSPIHGIIDYVGNDGKWQSEFRSKSGNIYCLSGPPQNIFRNSQLRKLVNHVVGSSDWSDVSYLASCVVFEGRND